LAESSPETTGRDTRSIWIWPVGREHFHFGSTKGEGRGQERAMVGESLKGHVGEAARKDDELTPYPVGCDNVYTVRLIQIGVDIMPDTIHGSDENKLLILSFLIFKLNYLNICYLHHHNPSLLLPKNPNFFRSVFNYFLPFLPVLEIPHFLFGKLE